MEITTREYIEQLAEGVNDFIHIEYDECLIIAKVLYKVMNI